MRYGELTRKLTRLGYQLRRQAKGGHEVGGNSETRKRTIIPRHEAKDISQGTLRSILRDLGLTEQDLEGRP